MSFLTRLFGKNKKKELNLEVTKLGDSKTALRKTDEESVLNEKKAAPELTAKLTDRQKDWKVKALPEWKPGDVILDTYEVEDVISGGMGHVYIAHHKKWNVKLAIKSPNEMMLSDKDFFARILREANAWTELGLHPNIAYCYYVRKIEEVPHIIVEYVAGGNLREWIKEGKCIDYRTNLDLAIQFCHGMEHAHSKGMIHRDIKPENVLMTREGVLKITDFGLVRGQNQGAGGSVSHRKNDANGSNIVGQGLTTIGTRMGSEGYMAPEQEVNAHDVDAQADIFSFGACLYEMFCGDKPYKRTIGKKQDVPDPVRLSKDDNFPADIAKVLVKCVQWEPEDRYQQFKDIRQELSKIYKKLFGELSPFAELDIVDLEADGLNNQGVAYFELGRKEDAIECWEKSLKINQTHLEATYNLSLVQWRDAKIADDEVLFRLDTCGNNALTDQEKLSELKAYIHAERYAPDLAKDALEKFRGRYKDIFSGKNISQIKCLMEIPTYALPVALAADGRYAVSGSDDKALRLWNLETGQCLRTMAGHTDRVKSIALTEDSRHAVSAGWDKTLRLWDLETGQCLRTMEGHTDKVSSAALTAGGHYAVSAGWDKTLRLWDLESGQCLHTMEGHTDMVDSFALTADGRYAVSVSSDKTLRLWDLETGQCLRTMEGHTDGGLVAISPDGCYAISREPDEKNLCLWDLETGQCLRTMEGHTSLVSSVALTADSRYAVSAGWDKTLRLWDLESGQCLRTMEGHALFILSLSLTADSRYAVSAGWDKTLRLWDLESGQCLRTMEGHTDTVSEVAITADGRYAVSVSSDKTLRLWNLDISNAYSSNLMVSLPKGFEQRKTEDKVLNRLIGKAEELYNKKNYKQSLATLFTAWKEIGFTHNEAINQVYSKLLKKGKIQGVAFSFLRKILKHSYGVCSVTLTADSRYAVSAGEDKTLRLWDLESGQCLRTMEGHTDRVNSVALTADSRYAVSAGRDKTLRLWDLETGQCLRTMEGHTDMVNSVAITADGCYAVSGGGSLLDCKDNTLRLWDLETGQCLRTMVEHTDKVDSVAITPDGRFAVSGSFDKTVRLWNLETGQCLSKMEGHNYGISSVALNADARYAVLGIATSLDLRDLQTGQYLRTMGEHTDTVNSVAITPDGRYAVSGSEDKTVRLWNLETGQCLSKMEGHNYGISSVALTADARYAVSGSGDKTICLWELIWDLEFE